ncbi:MAG: hypothetical protein AAB542_04035 [Patescibacteria group bacterium]
MTENTKMKPVVVLIIGGVVILFVVGLTIQIFAKKAGTDIEKGKATFTDIKTGETVNIGGEKLPDTFPKDFPVYPGAKIVASLSNTQKETGNGFIVTFTAPDGHGLGKVIPFYKSELSANGWTITSSFDSDTLQTWEIAKASLQGSISITTFERDPMTIVVTLGQKD